MKQRAWTVAMARRMLLFAPLVDAFLAVLDPLLNAVQHARRWIVVEAGDDAFLVYRAERGATRDYGRIDRLDDQTRRRLTSNGQTVELRLHPDHVVRSAFSIPASAASFAADIVESRLDRLSPWPPEMCAYAYAAAAKPDEAGQIGIAFLATARAIVEERMDRLARMGLTPTQVSVADIPPDQPSAINLLGKATDGAGQHRRVRVLQVAGAAMTLSILAYAFSVIAISNAAERRDEAAAHLAAIRSRIVAAAGERDKDITQALLAGKRPEEARFHIIDRLSALLPDDTVLDGLDIQPGALRLTGTSSQASALIGLVEAEDGLAQASFAAPVVRQDDGRDRFDISVIRTAKADESGGAETTGATAP